MRREWACTHVWSPRVFLVAGEMKWKQRQALFCLASLHCASWGQRRERDTLKNLAQSQIGPGSVCRRCYNTRQIQGSIFFWFIVEKKKTTTTRNWFLSYTCSGCVARTRLCFRVRDEGAWFKRKLQLLFKVSLKVPHPKCTHQHLTFSLERKMSIIVTI